MFIETLEFTIPIDLCSLFSTLQKGPRSNLEFPASVNSYGTTQDACIQVGVRANKLTFKVDGVSSDLSMISKSECKTLKLAVFDVDRSLIPQGSENDTYENTSVMHPASMSAPSKRVHDDSFSSPVPAKSSRTSYPESPHSRSRSPVGNIPQPLTQIKPRSSNHNQPKPQSDSVNVKQEPEDPDLIEIEPDPEPDDIVPKKEAPYMQIDYSSDAPHTQTSQAALERVSFPPSSRSQSSSSFHQNVPHVPDYSEHGQSHHGHGDQSADDFLVFQEDNDYGDDNEADYSNDGNCETEAPFDDTGIEENTVGNPPGNPPGVGTKGWNQKSKCNVCGKIFSNLSNCQRHIKRVHQKISYTCKCGKIYGRLETLRIHNSAVHMNQKLMCRCGKRYAHHRSLRDHQKNCPLDSDTSEDNEERNSNYVIEVINAVKEEATNK